LGGLNDLESAIQAYEEASKLIPEWHYNRAEYIRSLAGSLTSRYHRVGDLYDLERALDLCQDAIKLVPEGHPEKARYLQTLATCFTDRYQRFGHLQDLEDALKVSREAVDLTPAGHPERARYLRTLAISSTNRYQRLENLDDLDLAIQASQKAVHLTPEGHPDQASHLQGLGISFTARAQRLGHVNDLVAAVQLLEQSVELTSEWDYDKPGRLQSLVDSLTEQYEWLGNLEDLDAALDKSQKAVDLTSQGQPDSLGYLQRLAISFSDQYQRSGDLMDLELALQKNQIVVEQTPAGHPERAGRLQSLALSFTDRYRRLGHLKDLEAALHWDREAVKLTPEQNPYRAGRLRNLAVSLTDRYQRLGDVQDLLDALEIKQEAVKLTPNGHRNRAGHLQSLAVSFTDLYQRSGNLKDLNSGLEKFKEAVQLTSEKDPEKAGRLRNLAVCFIDRYKRLRDVNDLQAALQMDQQAVELTPKGHPNRPGRLQNLAVSFLDRYEMLGHLMDLEAALQTKKEALELIPEEHPERAWHLQGLAICFAYRYRSLKQLEDLELVQTYYTDSFKIPTANPQSSWKAAIDWATFSEQFQPSDGPKAYSAAFNLLPEILWVGHSIPVRHDAIRRLEIGQVSSAATRVCIKLANLTSAVEILEQGLGTTFQQMLQLKTDVDGLPSEQADTFQKLSSELYSGTSRDPINLMIRRNELLKDIRKQPGLEYFLHPKPYSALLPASQGGPVVILNSHSDSCDGIIIINSYPQPIYVPLPNVTLEKLQSHQAILHELLGRCSVRSRRESASSRLFGCREQFTSKPTQDCFADMLAWLWTCVVAPVYHVIESVCTNTTTFFLPKLTIIVQHGIHNGRIWWLLTGAFVGLPLHASPPTDQFIHSYTTTLGSLLEGYAKKSSCTQPSKFGIVAVTHTGPGRVNYLKGVKEEVEKICSIIDPQMITLLEGEHATPDAVKALLQNCSWVHFACHGEQQLSEPTKSCLLLYNGVLELETILQLSLPNPQFVFLSACETTMGDPVLVNEAFHLVGGFIAAGFRSAIGSLWYMRDDDGPLVAEMVYSHMFRDGRQPQVSDAAEALHLAVKELRARKMPYERWMPFIHTGV
jgi:hypothetical protein